MSVGQILSRFLGQGALARKRHHLGPSLRRSPLPVIERGSPIVGHRACRSPTVVLNILNGGHGTAALRAVFLMLQADPLERTGHRAAALERLAEAISLVEKTQERWCEAELHRLKGQLLKADGECDQVESCFLDALAVARDQGARTWELRAAMSMARLWRDQGKRNEARDLLAPVYGWFTEGFDTLDLKEAKSLLDELSS